MRMVLGGKGRKALLYGGGGFGTRRVREGRRFEGYGRWGGSGNGWKEQMTCTRGIVINRGIFAINVIHVQAFPERISMAGIGMTTKDGFSSLSGEHCFQQGTYYTPPPLWYKDVSKFPPSYVYSNNLISSSPLTFPFHLPSLSPSQPLIPLRTARKTPSKAQRQHIHPKQREQQTPACNRHYSVSAIRSHCASRRKRGRDS